MEDENLENITEEETEEIESEDVGEETTEEVVEDIDPEKISIETRSGDEEKIDYGEDIDETDVKVIGSIVEKQTASVKKALQEQKDQLEVDDFISKKPEFAKYKPVILKYLKHDVYSKIPVKNIAAMVAADDLVRLGAKKEREAQAKADSTKTGGTIARKPEGGTTDWSRASKEDFEAHKRRVMGQQV